jgi:hypothetical protein
VPEEGLTGAPAAARPFSTSDDSARASLYEVGSHGEPLYCQNGERGLEVVAGRGEPAKTFIGHH